MAYINPLVTNGLSHHYHLDESTFNFRGSRSVFSFFVESHVSKQNSPRCDAAYTVCLCPMKRTSGLFELSASC